MGGVLAGLAALVEGTIDASLAAGAAGAAAAASEIVADEIVLGGIEATLGEVEFAAGGIAETSFISGPSVSYGTFTTVDISSSIASGESLVSDSLSISDTITGLGRSIEEIDELELEIASNTSFRNGAYIAGLTVAGLTGSGIFAYIGAKNSVPPKGLYPVFVSENVGLEGRLYKRRSTKRKMRVPSRSTRKKRMLSNVRKGKSVHRKKTVVHKKTTTTKRRKVGQSSKSLRRKSSQRCKC